MTRMHTSLTTFTLAALLLAQPASAQEVLMSQSLTVTPIAVSAQCLSFTNDFGRGARTGEVVALQAFLLGQDFLKDPAHKTGFFGPLTEGALKQFQASRRIPQSGKADLVTRAAIMIASCGISAQDVPLYVPMFRGVFGPTVASTSEEVRYSAIVNNEYSSAFTVSVDWGDGSRSQSDTLQKQGSHSFEFAHTYRTSGTYSVQFAVTNPSGKSNYSSLSVVIK